MENETGITIIERQNSEYGAVYCVNLAIGVICPVAGLKIKNPFVVKVIGGFYPNNLAL